MREEYSEEVCRSAKGFSEIELHYFWGLASSAKYDTHVEDLFTLRETFVQKPNICWKREGKSGTHFSSSHDQPSYFHKLGAIRITIKCASISYNLQAWRMRM